VIDALSASKADRLCHPGAMPTREYRLVVEGELSDDMGVVFEGMNLAREEGRTVLAGPVRDQTELQGLLQHVTALGLTLLEATAVEAGAKRRISPKAPTRKDNRETR
jgi:hypothetical protein